MATQTTCDFDLAEVWDAVTKAGATTYLWCEGGVSCDMQVVKLGRDHWLTVSDQEGYQLVEADEDAELVPEEGYDDDEAVRVASDVEGFVGVVGIPGERCHSYKWFREAGPAQAWANERAGKAIAEEHRPVYAGFLSGEEAFDVKWRDGNRVYFRPADSGPGFVPKWEEGAEIDG